MAKNVAWELINVSLETNMKESGLIINLMELALIIGAMALNLEDSLLKTKLTKDF